MLRRGVTSMPWRPASVLPLASSTISLENLVSSTVRAYSGTPPQPVVTSCMPIAPVNERISTKMQCCSFICASPNNSFPWVVQRRFSSTSAEPTDAGTPEGEVPPPKPKKKKKVKTEEEKELEEIQKDEEFVRNVKIGIAVFILLLPAFYYGNKWGKAAYWGGERSVRVSTSSHGKPSLGGPFTLVTHDGEPVSQAKYLGKWCFFYFGFVHCPEICPIELNRMSKVVDWVREEKPEAEILPLFVSCDPKRDSLLAIKEYLSVFHKDFVGLVGTPTQVNEACKSYRIYYSVPSEDQAAEDDYLIDHSIAIFLFDPKGQFVDFFGSRYDETEIKEKVLTYISNFEADPTWTNW